MRAAFVAAAVALLLAAPAGAEALRTADRPMARPTAAPMGAAAMVAAPPPPANPHAATPAARPSGPAAGASLMAAAITASRVGVPAAAQPAPTAALLDGDRARPRPIRTAMDAPPAASPAADVARLAALPAIRALPRPEASLMPASRLPPAPERIQTAAFVAPVSPDVLTTGRGALCGVPSLQGRRIAPVLSRINGCGIATPVEVTAVDGVPLSTPATIDCDTATALDRWVKTGLKRAIGGQGGGLARIQIAGSYTCRPMNNIRGNKLSEHGKGKAIDISGVTLRDGRSFNIARDWRKGEGAFLRAAYRSGCGIFGTTLGPGSDGHHEDHLHFDTASHRSPYCR